MLKRIPVVAIKTKLIDVLYYLVKDVCIHLVSGWEAEKTGDAFDPVNDGEEESGGELL